MTPAAGYPPQAGGFKRNRMRIILAFAAVYVLWGSTYLFIKYAIETVPPFLLGFSRFAIAGALLYAVARVRGARGASWDEVKLAAFGGVLMLGVGNGAVMWSQQTLPSGVTALIVSSMPIWLVTIDWLRPNGSKPRKSVLAGVVVGLIGIIILVGPRAIVGEGHIDEIAAFVLLGGSIAWAVGSLTTRDKKPGSPLVFSALQMLAASVAMLIMSIAMGEPAGFSIANVSGRSLIGFAYLVIFGSIIGYTAYVYLLGAVSAAKAATYAYVNPVIAVLLGWAFLDEPLGARTIVAAVVILGSVALISTTQSRPSVTGEHPLPRQPDEPQRTAA